MSCKMMAYVALNKRQLTAEMLMTWLNWRFVVCGPETASGTRADRQRRVSCCHKQRIRRPVARRLQTRSRAGGRVLMGMVALDCEAGTLGFACRSLRGR